MPTVAGTTLTYTWPSVTGTDTFDFQIDGDTGTHKHFSIMEITVQVAIPSGSPTPSIFKYTSFPKVDFDSTKYIYLSSAKSVDLDNAQGV